MELDDNTPPQSPTTIVSDISHNTIVTAATWPSDGTVNVVTIASTTSHDQCILDSGTNRIVFNDASWVDNTNSLPLTPTNTFIHGISGSIQASLQTFVGHSPIPICPTIKDNGISQGWLAQNKSIVTTYNSIDNT